MIAGDIWVERTIIGTGDIIIFAFLFLTLLVPVLYLVGHRIAKYVEDERRENRIVKAKLMSIGDGVPLANGIMAYFGTQGHWAVPFEHDAVCVMTGFSGYPRACLRVFPEKGEIQVCAFQREEGGRGEADILLELLVQAAKEKKESLKK